MFLNQQKCNFNGKTGLTIETYMHNSCVGFTYAFIYTYIGYFTYKVSVANWQKVWLSLNSFIVTYNHDAVTTIVSHIIYSLWNRVSHDILFEHIDGLVQDYSISIANALVILQSCIKPSVLTRWGRDKIDAISQTTSSSAFSWMKMFEFRPKFQWGLFLRVQLTIFQHWFR